MVIPKGDHVFIDAVAPALRRVCDLSLLPASARASRHWQQGHLRCPAVSAILVTVIRGRVSLGG